MNYVTGADGYLGKALVKAGFGALKCDVTSRNDVERVICHSKPDLVIHLAGKSNPDWCEQKEHVKEAIRVNFDGTHNVMEVCVQYNVPVVYLSSSQIWGGGWWESLWNKHAEYSKLTKSVNNYGMQKLAGETIALTSNIGARDCSKIIRTSFVFDGERMAVELHHLKYGSFVDAPTFIKRSFIHLDDFVSLLSVYCNNFEDMPTILHLAGSKTVSYYDFWLEVAKQYGFDRKLIHRRWIERNEMYSAKRPHNAGLDVSLSQKLGFPQFDYIGGIKRMKDE